MLVLENLDHTFDLTVGEQGVTVRKGNKWNIDDGVMFNLMETYSDGRKGILVGAGVAVDSWVGPFKDLPKKYLDMEHNVSARNPEVLLGMMKAGYGPEFNNSTSVTALIYRRLR